MAQVSEATVDKLAASLYEECLKAPSGQLWSIAELQKMVPGKNPIELTQRILNELLQAKSFNVLMQGKQTLFKAIPRDIVDKIKNMTSDEGILYGCIQEAAREGIRANVLKAKTNMHVTTMNKALSGLEEKRFVKSIKSIKYPTRKVYILYDLTPSINVTGGPWFTDSELDNEFINELLSAITKYITSKSFPRLAHGSSIVTSFPPHYTGYPSQNQIYLWVKTSKLTDVELAEADIRHLLDVLVYDAKVEKVAGGTRYKAVRNLGSINGFTDSPCGRCPVFDLCEDGGPVSASTCVYFEDWLNF